MLDQLGEEVQCVEHVHVFFEIGVAGRVEQHLPLNAAKRIFFSTMDDRVMY